MEDKRFWLIKNETSTADCATWYKRARVESQTRAGASNLAQFDKLKLIIHASSHDYSSRIVHNYHPVAVA